MMNWHQHLENELDHSRKIAVLGIGSILCGDDAAGMLVASSLKEQGREFAEFLLVMEGSTAPENFTGMIKEFAPDLLLLIDAAHIDGPVGEVAFIPEEQLREINFCTHMLPFSVLIDYLNNEVGCKMRILGIKPEHTEFASEPQKIIINAANDITQTIINSLKKKLANK